MSQIITNTPIWVFVLFFFLVFLGLSQVKDREIPLKRVFILPLIMFLLSLVGVFLAFGIDLISFSFYLLAFIFGIILNIALKLPRNCIYIKEKKVFFIKGSFIPLFLIMAIFFTKYFVGIVSAKGLSFIASYYYIISISFLYGFFSGIFFGRIFVLKSLKF